MSKSDIALEVAKKTGLSKAKSNEAVNTVFDSIAKSLKKNKRVSLVGFGTFIVRKRSARTGRNPQTGETIKIKAAKVPAFKAGAGLKKAVK